MTNPRSSSSSKPDAISANNLTLSREAKLSMLTSAIEITEIGKQVGITEVVKAAFSAVGIVLTKMKDTMKNKDDFIDVGVYCAQICFAIERGTREKTEGNLSLPLLEAITELTRIVNDIGAMAHKNTLRKIVPRFIFSNKDKEKLAGWQQDLSRLLQIFNTELNVTTTMTVEEMHRILVELDHFVRSPKELRTAIGSGVSGELPPPAPSLFFGRDDLVRETSNYVQERKHVALIGAGGIGKTSIAKAVLNHSSSQQYFTAGRFFVKCDDFVLSLNRFLGRVAEVVGATISQSAPLPSLRAFLLSRTHALLLVLDNAETILESHIKADVADAIDEISSCPMVSLLVTTRTTILPTNVSWISIQVPPLDLDSARSSFFWRYKHEKSSSEIDPVLIEVDCHPLSINILACAAAQDSLSIDELKRRWDVEKAHMLDLGPDSGKHQSLAASIQLSLNSPTMQRITKDALRVLQLVAFLPQGVETATLQQLVPTVVNVNRIADTLGRLSLTSRQEKFITMLAPIRLYILDTRPPEAPFLTHIRTFYYRKLGKYGLRNPGDKNFADGSWISLHDDNIEKLIGHQLLTAPDKSTVKACAIFLYCIYWHKARKTTLGAVVRSLHDDVSAFWKARSLWAIGSIDQTTGDYREARDFFESARNTYPVGRYKGGATECLIDLADLSYYEDKYAEANQQCLQALAECEYLPAEFAASCQQLLGRTAIALGKHSEAFQFLTSALKSAESRNDMIEVGSIMTYLGCLEFGRENSEEARAHFDAATIVFSDLGDNHNLGWCSSSFAGQEMAIRNFPKALDLLRKAQGFYLLSNSTLFLSRCVQETGRIHYFQKEYSAAKTHLTRAKNEFSVVGSDLDLIQNAYYLSWLEFRKGDYQEAKQVSMEGKKFFAEGNGYWDAMYARSLGEFAFHEGDKEGAAVLFAKAQDEFEAVGLTSEKMDKSIPEEDSEGWRWFRGGLTEGTKVADQVEDETG